MKSTLAQPKPLNDQLAQMTPKQARALLQTEVSQRIKQLLKLSESYDLNPTQGLFDLGMDSLLAIELRNYLQKLVDTKLSATLVFDYPTVEAITNFLAGDVLNLAAVAPEEPEATVPAAPTPDADPASEPTSLSTDELAALDEDTMEKLLQQKISTLKQRDSV